MNTLVVFVLSCFFTLISVSYGLYESASLNSTRTLTIATIESAPFVFIERENKSANGFVIDMLNELSRELNFEYRLKYVNKYGQQNPADGTWNGLIGEVMGKRVDFAAAPLTVTSERSKVVDFSLSWMQTGLGVMLQKPIGSGAKLPVHSLKELVADDKFTYGVIEGGSTHRFLKKSRFRLFKEMGDVIEMHPERFVESVAAAVERVRNDSFYAFIGENRLLRYFVRQSPCDLMTLPNPPLQTISYAFAFTPNHPLIDQINTKLLEMRESGYLHSLEEKWYPDDCSKPKICVCKKLKSSENSTSEENENQSQP